MTGKYKVDVKMNQASIYYPRSHIRMYMLTYVVSRNGPI